MLTHLGIHKVDFGNRPAGCQRIRALADAIGFGSMTPQLFLPDVISLGLGKSGVQEFEHGVLGGLALTDGAGLEDPEVRRQIDLIDTVRPWRPAELGNFFAFCQADPDSFWDLPILALGAEGKWGEKPFIVAAWADAFQKILALPKPGGIWPSFYRFLVVREVLEKK